MGPFTADQLSRSRIAEILNHLIERVEQDQRAFHDNQPDDPPTRTADPDQPE
ncbi:MAG: hypothetical protein LBK42_13765 [Propionibacteriaceae bacterium]|jgi:hypothetical protein|nr:hypothetical protein [Propionibacteriaceae bacterium]